MGRQLYLDTDEDRLPEGFTRVGYDADTGVYSYQDDEGNYWDGAPGHQYGTLRRVRTLGTELSQPTQHHKSGPRMPACGQSDNENSVCESLGADKKDIGEKDGQQLIITSREPKQTRPRAGTFSSLAGYFHRTQDKFANTGISREVSLPTPPKDENTPEKIAAPKRAVTFDQILGKG